ncbi:MAG: cupin-like domain-containing protein, partial [Microcoleaceae cyanobacterium]
IPVGWWHYVESLEVSISVSFTNFIFPNHYEWKFPQISRY